MKRFIISCDEELWLRQTNDESKIQDFIDSGIYTVVDTQNGTFFDGATWEPVPDLE